MISYKTWTIMENLGGPMALGVKPAHSVGLMGKLAPGEDENPSDLGDEEVGGIGADMDDGQETCPTCGQPMPDDMDGDENLGDDSMDMGGEDLGDMGDNMGDMGDDSMDMGGEEGDEFDIKPGDKVIHHIHHHAPEKDEFPGAEPTEDDLDPNDFGDDAMSLAGMEPDGDEGGEDFDNDGDGADHAEPDGDEEGEDFDNDGDGLDFDASALGDEEGEEGEEDEDLPDIDDLDDEEGEEEDEAPSKKENPFGKSSEKKDKPEKKEKSEEKPEKKEKSKTETAKCCKKGKSKKCMKFCNEDDGFMAALLSNTRGTAHRKQGIRFKEDAVIPPVNPNTGLVHDIKPGQPGFAPQGRVGGIGSDDINPVQPFFGFSQIEDLPSVAEYKEWRKHNK